MPLKITLDALSPSSVKDAIDKLEKYKTDLPRKAKLIVERLASMGALNASLGFSRAIYSGDKDISVETKWENSNTIVISANGEKVLFIEFGSGITYGYGHPEAGKHGMGPGTYPSEKGKWSDPNGWYYTDGNGNKSQHTFGNPPNAVMYSTRKEILKEVRRVAKEVFASG